MILETLRAKGIRQWHLKIGCELQEWTVLSFVIQCQPGTTEGIVKRVCYNGSTLLYFLEWTSEVIQQEWHLETNLIVIKA